MNDARAVAAIEHELASFGSRHAIEDVLPDVHRLLEIEAVLVLTPAEGLDGLEVARFQSVGFRDADGVRAGFADVFRRQPRRYAWYDPIRPEPEQRNRVIEAHAVMGPGELEQSYIYQRALRPFGLQSHRQPRVLLCEGASLLAWFGGFHPEPVTPRHLRMLRRLARPMRRRLALERQLGPLQRSAALVAALEQLGAPAFVLAGQRIVEANASARTLLAARRREVLEALSSPPGATSLDVDHVPVCLAGYPELRLAIVRGASQDARIAHAVERAAASWRLSPRQCDVLRGIVRGDASATIAAELAISDRAVELHVTAMFGRAGVTSRAELAAAALLADSPAEHVPVGRVEGAGPSATASTEAPRSRAIMR